MLLNILYGSQNKERFFSYTALTGRFLQFSFVLAFRGLNCNPDNTIYCKYKRNSEGRSCHQCCRAKAISITYSKCVSVTLITKHTKYITVSYCHVSCLALPHFSTLSHKWHDFWEERYWKNTCVLIFSASSDWNISNSKKNLARYYHKCT